MSKTEAADLAKSAALATGAVLLFLALTALSWAIVGGIVALLAWIGFAIAAPALGVTFLHLWLPGSIVAGIIAVLSPSRG